MFRILTLIALIAPAVHAAEAPAAQYVNNGVASNEVVNAVTFINNGEFYANSQSVPWDSQNTRFYVNRGVMRGSLGFRFDNVVPGMIQSRQPAESFINFRTGQISGFDGGGNGAIIIGGGGFTGLLFNPDTSFVTVNARSITNRGLISSGSGGVVRVLGGTVDLSGGALGVDPLGTFTDFNTIGFGPFLSETNFFPDPGLYDQGWSIESITNMFLGGIIGPDSITSPIFNITNRFSCSRVIQLFSPQVWVRETVGSATNFNIEVVAVRTGDTNIWADVRFMPFYFPNGSASPNGLLTPAVELNARATNLFTLQTYTNRIYIFDQLATSTNQNLLVNSLAGTFRPAPWVVFRGSDQLHQLFELGEMSNSIVTPDLFDSPAYSNQVVTNIQTAYALQVESLQTRLPAVPGVGATNLPGRVEVRANDLTMTAARIRGEGYVSIRATNFLDASDSIVDVPRLGLNLGSSGSPLRVQGLARESVERLNGPILMYSALWTNTLPNPDTNAGPIEVRLHLTIVDASDLRGLEQTTTHELVLNSRNGARVEINDPLTLTAEFRIDSDNLTLNNRLVLTPGRTWNPTNLVRLSNFTNNGALLTADLAEFSQSGGGRYRSFVNNGRIQAYASLITADYFENRGGDIISTQYFALNETNDFCLGTVAFRTNFGPSIGAIAINANVASFNGGLARTSGDIRYTGGVFKFNNHRTEAGGRLLIEGLSTLTDTGSEAGNTWRVGDGFHLGLPRPEGDLLGTTINTFAPTNAFIDHVWSAEDRGATAAGFDNNLALGRLIVEGQQNSRVNFTGPTAGRFALYTEILQLEGDLAASIASLQRQLRLTSFNIYYADVRSGNANLTAESLNGLVVGTSMGATNRLVWVPSYAGPNSSVDILLRPGSTETDRMNIALRTSTNLDSDGDGLPNRYDEYPLFADPDVRFVDVQLNEAQNTVSLGFAARANSGYVVEYATNLANPNWQLFKGDLQTGSTGVIISVTDEVRKGSPQRYYRVRRVSQP